MAENDQANMLEDQKKNCPFCKIIKGEIPSKTIFKSNKIQAILDINPASKGHSLIMPKEHYPILPLIPDDVFNELFTVTTRIADIEKVLFLKEGTTIFIANGGAAGQQSSHFMTHVIARDSGELTQFNLVEKDLNESKLDDIYKTLSHNLPIMLKSDYTNFPIKDKNDKPIPLKQNYSKEQVINIIKQNSQLLNALKQEPREFKEAIPKNNQLASLFETVDINEILEHFSPGWELKPEIRTAEIIEETSEQKTKINGNTENKVNSKEEILKIINENKKLKEFIINNTDEFKKSLPGSEKLKELFKNVNVDEIINELNGPPPAPKKKDSTNSNLDDITRLF